MKIGRVDGQFDPTLGAHAGIAAIYKVSLKGLPQLIGTGFWVTDCGHLITAWHVIEDNIGQRGIDNGPIYAMQMSSNGVVIPRVLRKSYRHPSCDLAFSETYSPIPAHTHPSILTLERPKIGDVLSTRAFMSEESIKSDEYVGVHTASFDGTLYVEGINAVYSLAFGATLTTGRATSIFEEGRDRVMLPFPCFESSIPLYGANSGGPVFDSKGRICGVNCSGFAGENISYHVPLTEILEMSARDIVLEPEDPRPRYRSIAELGLMRRVPFDPPVEKHFLPTWKYWLSWILLKLGGEPAIEYVRQKTE